MKAILTAIPEKRMNIVEWFEKLKVSSNVTSNQFATQRAIERQYLNDLNR